MPNPTPSPVREAAVRAAERAFCCGDAACANEDAGIACSALHLQQRVLDGIRRALAAYERAMGRNIDAEQIERMR